MVLTRKRYVINTETAVSCTIAVTTMYRVHAKDVENAKDIVRETVKGGIFNDNIVIIDQIANMYVYDTNTSYLGPQQFSLVKAKEQENT